MSTRPQIAMIHTLKSKIRMTDDDYRVMLSGFGVESSKDLSTADAKAFIEALMRMVKGGNVGAAPRGRPAAPAAPGDTEAADAVLSGRVRYAASNAVATYAQQAKIRHLWDNVSRAPEPERARALNRFLEKHFKISHLSWLPRERVGKVIHTLAAMQKQSNPEVINDQI